MTGYLLETDVVGVTRTSSSLMMRAAESFLTSVSGTTTVPGYPQGVTPDLATMIASDAIRPFYEHLEGIGYQDRIDLFLYSRGGDTNIPLRLVRLVREHCKFFSVLVPFRAHSAATMICLGADEIVMGKMGEISPVDPTTANVFNPIDPINPDGRPENNRLSLISFRLQGL